MVNMLLLAVIDMVNYRVPLIRRMAVSHTLTAVLASLLMLVAVLFLLADIDVTIGWVGLDSLIIIGLYFGGVWLVQQESRPPAGAPRTKSLAVSEEFPSLKKGLLGFTIAAAALVVIVPQLVRSTAAIAEMTGLGESFVGVSLLSVVTSLPELLAALAAVRIGAVDLAIGNLFGSSVFNMLGLGLADFFYTDGRFLGSIDPAFAMVGLLALLLTNMALLANLARIERRFLFIEADSLAIIVMYLVGMYLLFIQGT